MSKEQTPIVTDGFKPPFRVGRKLQRAIVDSNGRELQTFNEGLEELAQMVCDMLNGTYCNAKTLGNTKLYTEEQVIEIIWEAVNQIEASYNIQEVTEEFIKNKFGKTKTLKDK